MTAPDTGPIRVFLIDDHRSVMWGLEKLIESDGSRMQVVGKATGWLDALEMLDEDECDPDVILLDLDLGKERGIDGIPRLLAQSRAKILILTGVRDQPLHDRAMLVGASGVVEKESSAETILLAIKRVHEGQLWLDRAATGRVFLELSRSNDKSNNKISSERQKIANLTVREKQVIETVTANPGEKTGVHAVTLRISEHTLRNHLTSIYEKLDITNRVELFAFAHKHRLTGVDSAKS